MTLDAILAAYTLAGIPADTTTRDALARFGYGLAPSARYNCRTIIRNGRAKAQVSAWHASELIARGIRKFAAMGGIS